MTKLSWKLPTYDEFHNFLNLSAGILKSKKAVSIVNHGPALYVGDIHGHFHSLLNAIKIAIKKSVKHVIFMGDYSDRGPEQLRCLLNVIYLQIASNIEYQHFKFIDPLLYSVTGITFSVLRGNHEDVEINKRYGFKTELPSDETERFEFSILAGMSQGKPQVELESIIEFARFNQKTIAKFTCGTRR